MHLFGFFVIIYLTVWTILSTDLADWGLYALDFSTLTPKFWWNSMSIYCFKAGSIVYDASLRSVQNHNKYLLGHLS